MALITQSEFFDYYQQSTATEEKDMTLADLVIGHTSQWLETYLGRKLAQDDYTQHTRAHAPTRQILLKNAPVASVASIMEGSISLSSSDWTLDDGDLGIIWMERPLVVNQRYAIEYTGGFNPLPEDIKGVLLRQASIAFKRTRDQSWELQSVDTDTNSGVSISERLTSSLSPIERTVLSRYRVI